MKFKFVALAALTVVGAGWVFLGISKSMVRMPPQLVATTIVQAPTLTAELGGATATIPREYLRYLTLDKNASAGRRVILSFGYDFRLEDGAVMNLDLYDDWIASQKGRGDSTWLAVSLDGYFECLPCRDDIINKFLQLRVNAQKTVSMKFSYKEMPGLVHGLRQYKAISVDGESIAGLPHVSEIYYGTDKNGKVDKLIDCMTVAYPTAACTLKFSLLPDKNLLVSVSFKKKKLSEWQSFESAVKNQIYGFYGE
ncbi:hypothetical protein ACOTHJ_13145 [Achromobacter xylosoxidans]|uniref:hypothetical protein n=1 Tax=Achromobacter anxifer TaxID=1287737 RepID=UPI0015902AFE|nr:hypothetical protein [Achromobacter anxifer]